MLQVLDQVEPRSANYGLLRPMESFEPVGAELLDGTCGNIRRVFDGKYDKDRVTGNWCNQDGIFGGKSFYEVVSAPMLLAKLVAAFPGVDVNATGQEAYKVTWTVVLKHKKSGNVITFYDYKGASSYGSNAMPKDVRGAFKKDTAALLLALADDAFPHPYDGCRIGEIA